VKYRILRIELKKKSSKKTAVRPFSYLANEKTTPIDYTTMVSPVEFFAEDNIKLAP